MKINQVLVEAAGATVAFAFGRFNPAHQGHIEVWRAVEEAGSNWFIGTNPTTLGPNDPLTFQQKSSWMEEIYPPIAGHIVPEQSVLTLAAYIFKKLRKNENATVAYITDANDWAWSGKLLNQYNGVEGAHGYYKFAQIIHVPSPRVSSATALRDAARADDRVAFYHASGTDPKSKIAGLTYFDTVKQACEKYPLPVKKAKKVKEQSLAESTSLETTIKAIVNDTGEPVTATYETLKYLAKKYVKDHGELDRGWRMVAMGPGAKWVEQFYKDKLKNELYDLVNYRPKETKELQQFLRGVEIDGELDMKRSFSNISNSLPEILINLGNTLPAPQITKNAVRWMKNLKDYHNYLASLEDDDDDYVAPAPAKSTLPGQQNAQVEQIVNDTLAKLPKNVAGEIRNIIARSANKLQALQQELNRRNITVEESTQKTVAKTWDQMTPQEKISGVKGRTVWNEKTQRYYTVFDVPVKQSTNEASLETMRNYFAGDEKAHDPFEITKQRLHFAKDKNAKPTVDKRFRSPEEYQAWLKQNKLRQISGVQEDEEAGEVEQTGQLIPFPAGTTKVSVSDVYDWYKLGQVISDLDDANPADFGQGAPETVIAFGSEEEENKLMPLLQRLGLKLKDIDYPVKEAYHAGSLYEILKKNALRTRH